MNGALIAHDNMKDDLVLFANSHRKIFEKFLLFRLLIFPILHVVFVRGILAAWGRIRDDAGQRGDLVFLF